MDLDAYVGAHRAQWDRLEELVRRGGRPRRLTGGEVDELVGLYQHTATHLSVVQSAGPDPALIGRLSSLVARARSVVAGGRRSAWGDVARFLKVDFPAICYRTRWWWLACGLVFVLVGVAVGAWVASDVEVQQAIGDREEIRQLVEQDFESYYSSAPAQDFAARVFTNNAYLAAQAILLGVLLVPVIVLLLINAVNVGVAGGLMVDNDRAGLFFGLILPHGLLELTAVFVACGLGLRLGWTVVDPGARSRSTALAEEGRSLVGGAVGLALVLLISGVLEAYVTPSPLPTWGRVGIGVVAELLFLGYVLVLGRRAVHAGRGGDLQDDLRGDVLPVSA